MLAKIVLTPTVDITETASFVSTLLQKTSRCSDLHRVTVLVMDMIGLSLRSGMESSEQAAARAPAQSGFSVVSSNT